MNSSSDSETPEQIIDEIPDQTNPIPPQETLENQNSDVVLVDQNTSDSPNNGDEEEAECGFCLYMKGGGCKDSFIDWEKCMEEAEEKKEDVVEKCYQVTLSLKNCMEAHPDYYAPILKAEKAAEQQVTKGMEELNKEKESKGTGGAEVEVKEIEIEIEIENDDGIELQNKIEKTEGEAVKMEKSTDLESVVAVKESGGKEVKEVELNNKIAEEELVEKKIEKQTDSESVVAGKDEEVKEVVLNNKVAEEETKNPVMSFFDKVFSFKF